MQVITKDHIKKLIIGDEKIFKEVFDSFYPKLVGFAVKYLVEQMQAEDIVSEVFRKVWEKRGMIDDIGSFESFLYTAVKNSCLNQIRSSSVQKNRDEILAQELNENKFHETIIEENVHFKLYQAIESLPDKMRQVFELSVIHNLKEKEIAVDLGISVNTVKVHKQRALKSLRGKLGKNYVYLFLF